MDGILLMFVNMNLVIASTDGGACALIGEFCLFPPTSESEIGRAIASLFERGRACDFAHHRRIDLCCAGDFGLSALRSARAYGG